MSASEPDEPAASLTALIERTERIERTVAGDAAAWQALVLELAPRIEAIARAHQGLRSRGLAALPDDLAEVTTAALERLAAQSFKNLARFLEQLQQHQHAGSGDGAQSFDSWLYGAVDFTIREHLRKRFGRAPHADPSEPSLTHNSKRDLGTLAARFDDERMERAFVSTLGVTGKITAREIFTHIDASFDALEARALHLYYEEERSLVEIASELGLEDERAADKLIRKLNARLRYKFAGDTP